MITEVLAPHKSQKDGVVFQGSDHREFWTGRRNERGHGGIVRQTRTGRIRDYGSFCKVEVLMKRITLIAL